MSNPIEPKFPKRRFSAHYDREIEALDGCYLLPAGVALSEDDWSWTPGDPEWVNTGFGHVPDQYAWTYARRLPEGRLNDDLPVQSAPDLDITVGTAYAEEQRRLIAAEAEVAALRKEVAEYKSAMDSSSYEREQATIRCRDAEATAAQLRDALHAVYENCRQNHNRGIGAGPLAMARSALIAAGVDPKAPLPFEGAPEAEPELRVVEPHIQARAAEQRRVFAAEAEMVSLRNALRDVEARGRQLRGEVLGALADAHAQSARITLLERILPALIEHRQDLRPADVARQAAEMARIALEHVSAFATETSAPPTDPEPHPGAPVLRMTHDGKVTAFGAIEAPPGYYLLPAGEKLRCDDRSYAQGEWCDVTELDVTHVTHVEDVYQFTFARKLPADGPVS